MNIELIDVLIAIAIGLGATLVMDLWSIFLKRVFGLGLYISALVTRFLFEA